MDNICVVKSALVCISIFKSILPRGQNWLGSNGLDGNKLYPSVNRLKKTQCNLTTMHFIHRKTVIFVGTLSPLPLPQWKMTSMRDNRNERLQQWKMTLIWEDLNERRPKWNTAALENVFNRRKLEIKFTFMEDDM